MRNGAADGARQRHVPDACPDAAAERPSLLRRDAIAELLFLLEQIRMLLGAQGRLRLPVRRPLLGLRRLAPLAILIRQRFVDRALVAFRLIGSARTLPQTRPRLARLLPRLLFVTARL